MEVTGNDTAKRVARWAALAALFLIPFAPLVVANTYFFPFITGKAFYLRILIEVAVVAWLALAALDKEYRPRFSWIGAAVVGFVAWMFVADAFALNAAKAFWSNFERMEGWVLLVHLLGFFFAASAVLRVEKKWRAWLFTSLGTSLIIAAYALLQLNGSLAIHQGSTRIDATLGNSAYLAVYFLFSVFVALWLALSERRSWLKWSLIAVAALEAILLFFTETRGTVLGLISAFALVAILTLATAEARMRRFAAGALALLVIAAGGLYLARDSSFVQGNRTLQRIASISLNDGQTRFTIWHMAFQGALERPLTGWGQEGFNYIFNKYYDPSLYQQESWFDRAHNAFIDWLTAGGIPAFVLYLSLFGTAIALLWRSSGFSRAERIVLTAALAGYAVHNLFVFDNLYSYIYFFALLALIDSRSSHEATKGAAQFSHWIGRVPVLDAEKDAVYVLPVAAVALFALIWFVNVPGMRVATRLITAMTPSPAGVGANISAFQNLAARPAFAAQEVREQLVAFAANVVKSPAATDAQKQQAVALAVTEMRKQVEQYPLDARERLQLAFALRTAGDSAAAMNEIKTAVALSPKKEEMWIQAGAAAWDLGDVNAAREDFATAYALGPQFPALAIYAAAGAFAAGDTAAADQILRDAYGTTVVDSDVLAVAYYHAKDWQRLIALWKLRAEKPGASVEAWFALASARYLAGESAEAIKTITAAVKLFPSAAPSGAAAIKQIQNGVR